MPLPPLGPNAGKTPTAGGTAAPSSLPPLGPNVKGASTAKKKKGFIGVNLPTIGIAGHNLVDLPSVGVSTSKKNPAAQVSQLVTGFVPGLVKSVYGLGKEAATAVNPNTNPLTSGGNKPVMEKVHEKLPLSSGLVEHAIGTAKLANPADITKLAHPETTALGKRVHKEGVLNTVIGTGADLALLAGGAGLGLKAAGFGKLAEAARLEEVASATSRAAGLGAKADEAQLAGAATKAAAAGDVQAATDLDAAAKQVSRANELKTGVAQSGTGTQLLSKAAKGAETTAKLGGHVANAPAKPFELLAKGVKGVAEPAIGALAETKYGNKIVQPAEKLIAHTKNRMEVAGIYHDVVTSKSQQALYRHLENGETAETVRAGLKAQVPEAGPGINALYEDLKTAETNLKGKIPRGEMGANTPGLLNDIRSKSPSEWAAEGTPLKEKLTAAKEHRASLPDGDPGYKAANKAVTEAQKAVTRNESMRKMSAVEPDFVPEVPPAPDVAEAKALPEPTTLEEAAKRPNGPNAEEVKQFHKENVGVLTGAFHKIIQERFAPNISVKSVIPDALMESGAVKKLVAGADKELHARGYIAWNPETGQALKAGQIGLDSAVLPKDIFEAVQNYTKEQGFGGKAGALLKAYDSATGTFKHTVLALSPRWHFGNVVGNLMMAGAAGLSPLEIVKFGMEARKMVKAGESPAELLASGYHFSEQGLKNLGAETKFRQHPIAWSYNMNQYVDDVNRTMIYLAKKAEGVSSQAAVSMALKAAGDFGRMSPFERDYIKRAIPFWAWQKHITKLAFRLPLEAPARVAWTMHLSNMGNEVMPDENAGGFNKGTIGLGGMRLDLRSADPFGSSFFMDPSVRGLTRQLNPIASMIDVATTGHTFSRGNEAVRTPQYQFGQTGKPLGGSLSNFGKILAHQIPQVTQAQDLIAGQTKTRLDTGELAKKQYPEDAQNRWQQLLKIAGLNIRPNVKKAATTAKK